MEVEARIDPGSLRKLLRASRTWDASARREMRKGLRLAAAQGAEAAKSSILGPPPGGGRSGTRSTGLRRGLAGGVKVSIRGGRESGGTVTGEGVRVAATPSHLLNKEAMVKASMAKEFRHPVFGQRNVWVKQRGKNWFYGPLFRNRANYQKAVVDAIEAATKAIAD